MTVRQPERIVATQKVTDGGGVRLRRALGTPQLEDLDPFLLLDEFRSDDPGRHGAGFPDHPHRGIETVTYMLAGAIRHGDNQGNTGRLAPGDVQWMTAGRGIVHSEMPEPDADLLWGFQLWVNLSARDKMTAPRYREIKAAAVPLVAGADGATVKVIAGTCAGVVGAVSGIAVDPIYFDVTLPAGAVFSHAIAAGHQSFAYVLEGALTVGAGRGARTVEHRHLAVLGPGDEIRFAAPSIARGRALLIAGRPHREPIVKYGPFVMNTREEIREAIDDFREGRF